MTLTNMAHGAGVLAEWVGSGHLPVPAWKAVRRALVCETCVNNRSAQGWKDRVTAEAAKVVKAIFKYKDNAHAEGAERGQDRSVLGVRLSAEAEGVDSVGRDLGQHTGDVNWRSSLKDAGYWRNASDPSSHSLLRVGRRDGACGSTTGSVSSAASKNRVLFVTDRTTKHATIQAVCAAAKPVCAGYETILIDPCPLGPKWPKGANWAFMQASKKVQDAYKMPVPVAGTGLRSDQERLVGSVGEWSTGGDGRKAVHGVDDDATSLRYRFVGCGGSRSITRTFTGCSWRSRRGRSTSRST